MPNKDSDASTSVKLGALKKRLDRLGEVKDRSTHWLIKQAVERYLEDEEAAIALKKETLMRWEEEALIDNTVPHHDVMQWLDTWDEKGVKPPKWK